MESKLLRRYPLGSFLFLPTIAHPTMQSRERDSPTRDCIVGCAIVGRKRKDPRGYRRSSLDSIREGREAHNQGHPTGTVRGGGTAVRVRSRKYGLCRHKVNPIYFLITSEARDLQLKRYKGTADSSSLLLLGMTTLLIG